MNGQADRIKDRTFDGSAAGRSDCMKSILRRWTAPVKKPPMELGAYLLKKQVSGSIDFSSCFRDSFYSFSSLSGIDVLKNASVSVKRMKGSLKMSRVAFIGWTGGL